MDSGRVDGLRRRGALLCALLGTIALSGCAEMYFANTDLTDTGSESPEMVLTRVSADLTSGTRMYQRLIAEQAVLFPGQTRLGLQEVLVESYDEQGRMQSLTTALKGRVYLTADEQAGRNKFDVELEGSIVHRVLKPEDPAIEQARLMTSELLWDAEAEMIRGMSNYTLAMRQPSGREVMQTGEGFETTQDLRIFRSQSGTLGTETTGSLADEGARIRERVEGLLEEVDSQFPANGGLPPAPPQ